MEMNGLLVIDDSRCANREIAGGKAATIHMLRKSQFAVHVPNAIVIPPDTDVSVKELDDFLCMLNAEKFAVRSSATLEDALKSSFAGQFESVLDVSGTEEILTAIEQVRSSVRTDHALTYMQKNGLDESQCRMAVLIMPMAGDECSISGTIFTIDPESGLSHVYITACEGLGDREVAGLVTPEVAVVNDKGVTIRQKPRPGLPILLDMQTRMLLAQTAQQVKAFIREQGICEHVDIEYVISENKLWVLQIRPVTVRVDGKFKTIRPEANKTPIVKSGLAATRGIGIGRLICCHDVRDAENISNGDVMFCENTTSIWEPYMMKASAILTRYGSANCHTAVVSREWKIPCIVGIGNAADNLPAYASRLITVDATACVVYEGEVDEADLIIATAVPQYAGLDDVTLDEHFSSASGAGQTFIDSDGTRYIGRPAESTGEALHRIHKMSHDIISREMGWPLVRHRVRDERFEVMFADIHSWIERLRGFTPNKISVALQKWENTLNNYIESGRKHIYFRECHQKFIQQVTAF